MQGWASPYVPPMQPLVDSPDHFCWWTATRLLQYHPGRKHFLFIALCLLAVLLSFWDGLPKWGGKREDKA